MFVLSKSSSCFSCQCSARVLAGLAVAKVGKANLIHAKSDMQETLGISWHSTEQGYIKLAGAIQLI